MSSLEDGRGKLSRNPRTETSFVDCKLEPSVRDLSRRVTRANSRLSLDGGERYAEERGGDEAKDAKGNNNNNCNGGGGERRRRASAVEILRRNFGVSRSPSLCFNTNSRMQRGAELEPREANDRSDVPNVRATEAGECKKSERETGDAGTKNEPTASDSTAGVERVAVTSRRSSTRDGDVDAVASDESLNGKEHVYCTVYCIESEILRKKDDEAVASDAPAAPDGALDPEAGREAAPGPEPAAPGPEPAAPYTLDDLVDPLGDVARRPSARQAGAETATQGCRVCLEEKTIAPLPCCRKAVCDECLKLYVSSQVRVAKSYIGCPIPECSGYLDEGLVISHLANEDVAKYRYFLELSQLDSSTKPCPQCSQFTSLEGSEPDPSEHKYKARGGRMRGTRTGRWKPLFRLASHIQCSNCQFVWCFKCHAPWHSGVKCRDYRKGDKLLRGWASVIEHGQRNAQKCPQCRHSPLTSRPSPDPYNHLQTLCEPSYLSPPPGLRPDQYGQQSSGRRPAPSPPTLDPYASTLTPRPPAPDAYAAAPPRPSLGPYAQRPQKGPGEVFPPRRALKHPGTSGHAPFEQRHVAAETTNQMSVVGVAPSDGPMSMLPQLGDSEEKLRQRQRLRQLILRQQQQRGLQEAGPSGPHAAGPGLAPPPHWAQPDPSTAPPIGLFGRPPPPYPGTGRPCGAAGAPGPRFPGGFPGEQQRGFSSRELPVQGPVPRSGFPPGAPAGLQDSFSRPPQGAGPGSEVPFQMTRPVEFTGLRPPPPPGARPHPMSGLPQPFLPPPLQQHSIMGQPYIELRHRAPEPRPGPSFSLPEPPLPSPRDPRPPAGPGPEAPALDRGLGESSLPEEHLEDSAVKDLEDVEVKDLVDLNLNLDPEDGKEDLDLGPHDLHLDDFLLSGKFDLIAYADPELNLEDKKDMFNEELALGGALEEAGGRGLMGRVKQEVQEGTSTPHPGGVPTSTLHPGGVPTSTPHPGGVPTTRAPMSTAACSSQTQEQAPSSGMASRVHTPMAGDFDSDPIMKAKMVALKGINKVMTQGSLGLDPIGINR
ncbi:putative E3 ubiquitin-protein ligase [Liparis tanakae]|uniref:RBR-type E3 ubiquitin transferase n=1 Tax=Liparis tanakae TaxID=230148 RepID=A0A4Z2GL57_9TELE|nr:putative E3 ubiquitin-protein ligase [Liparis tanakae]